MKWFVLLEIPFLRTKIPILQTTFEFNLTYETLISANKNPNITAAAFSKISRECHCRIIKTECVNDGTFSILDPNGIHLTYLNGNPLSDIPIRLFANDLIQLPLIIDDGMVTLEIKVNLKRMAIEIPSNPEKSPSDSEGTMNPVWDRNAFQITVVSREEENNFHTSLPHTSSESQNQTHFILHRDIEKLAFEIYSEQHSYDECVWFLAEISLMLDKSFSEQDRPQVTQRIGGTFIMQKQMLTVKPNDQQTRIRAQEIFEKFHPSLQDLHWLIAERRLLFKILKS